MMLVFLLFLSYDLTACLGVASAKKSAQRVIGRLITTLLDTYSVEYQQP
jgi:hypothetical protein